MIYYRDFTHNTRDEQLTEKLLFCTSLAEKNPIKNNINTNVKFL